MKSPDHHSPSGDRAMARLLFKALQVAGYAPFVASSLRTHDKHGESEFQERAQRDSFDEAERLIARYRNLPVAEQPALWFTYHVYYKAPDWIGPHVARALQIPYIIAEGSRAGKRADGPWSLAHRGAEHALDQANVIFAMTAVDKPALEAIQPALQTIVDLPPFLDEREWKIASPRAERTDKTPRLLTVAMMRKSDKLESYRILANALLQLQHLPWSLDIAGDGDARDEVRSFFSPLGSRVRFHGQCETSEIRVLYRSADIFVWPAVNEAYGMALLEAQLFGIPVVAGNFGGVGSVVRDGETGILTRPCDMGAFAEAVNRLIGDPTTRRRLGDNARTFVKGERTLSHAAARLRHALEPLSRPRTP